MEINQRQKVLAIVAIAGLALLAADNLVIEPLIKSWKSRSQYITQLRSYIADGTKMIERESITRDRWGNMRTNTFPSPESQAENEMLKCFDRWSQTSGISVSSLKPQWKQTDDDYNTLICRADASGNMETLSRFLYELEKDPLALKVEAVEITSRETDGQQLTLGLQVSGLLLTSKKQ